MKHYDDLADAAWIRALAEAGALPAIRAAAGLTQADVASAMRVAPSTVMRWEKGRRVPRREAAIAYARLLREVGGLERFAEES